MAYSGKNPEPIRLSNRARMRALQEVAKRHRDEYRAILELEKAKLGIRTLRPREISEVAQ